MVARAADFLRDLAAGWDGRRVLIVAHSASRRASDHLLHGRALAELVDAPFDWRPGWSYRLPDGWDGTRPGHCAQVPGPTGRLGPAAAGRR
ncbi:hypothetical protein [Micromonospora inyonensis]|uniref:Histidine phosphatase superfamily (Branch 1) n=1 Tax=Micromonospora inyonensis TaxID=47866 RepID=A0A1C6SM63_9ACTN|nr:hypothetical protein [Micromonospora inyonensis]SCL30462.1 hypothetical protein GA0074694_5701 [Micromonospora inyonensis]